MEKFINNRKGFSLMEFMIGSAIGVLIFACIMVIYIMALSSWKEGNMQVTLQREASITMEKMVRGVDGNNGVREADQVSLPNSYTIEYTSGIDGTERSFYLSGTDIVFDPDTSVAGDEYSIANVPDGITLAFTESSDMVTIALGLQGDIKDRTITINLSTNVYLRN